MALCRVLRCTLPSCQALPGAQCLWRESSETNPVPEHLVCASPVHVVAGSDDAQLTSVTRLNLSLDETHRLVAELNEALADDTRSFLHDEAGNWFHKGMPATALDTAPPTAVEGHPMTLALPRSDQARVWRSLWSESQMVLHQSDVNKARQTRGEPEINSLWFWGGGALPEPKPEMGTNTVLFTDDPYGCGLADALHIKRLPLAEAERLDMHNPTYHHYVVLDSSLMHGNPDFIEQRDLGRLWGERITGLMRGSAHLEAELTGLTGCQELFVAPARKSGSLLSRLAAVFRS